MRCSFGHCQTTFHALCARTTPGFHFRASDGQKPQFRAYCDAHGEQQRVRDLQRGVPPAVVPPPPEMAPVTMAPGSGRRDAHADARPAAARRRPPPITRPRGCAPRTPRAAAVRADLLRARGVCKAVLRRESVKREIARGRRARGGDARDGEQGRRGRGRGGAPRGGENARGRVAGPGERAGRRVHRRGHRNARGGRGRSGAESAGGRRGRRRARSRERDERGAKRSTSDEEAENRRRRIVITGNLSLPRSRRRTNSSRRHQ